MERKIVLLYNVIVTRWWT